MKTTGGFTNQQKIKIVVISGPTAVGKSDIAVELALHFNAEIVNADSMQVYRYMDIGTAKLTPDERKGITHHMIDIVNPDEEFNAGRYIKMASPIIRDIHERGKRCFVVGGTGLYIKALLKGLISAPPIDMNLRKRLKEEINIKGLNHLYKRLMSLDPDTAKNIHPNDRVRITRALEIIELTGKRLSDLKKEHQFKQREFRYLYIGLFLDRKELYERINRRTLKMVEMGLLDETRHLLDMGYGPELKSMNSIGYRHMIKVIMGDWSMDEAIRLLSRDTRHYAKRQFTWFRKEPEIKWMNPRNIDEIESEIGRFLENEI